MARLLTLFKILFLLTALLGVEASWSLWKVSSNASLKVESLAQWLFFVCCGLFIWSSQRRGQLNRGLASNLLFFVTIFGSAAFDAISKLSGHLLILTKSK